MLPSIWSDLQGQTRMVWLLFDGRQGQASHLGNFTRIQIPRQSVVSVPTAFPSWTFLEVCLYPTHWWLPVVRLIINLYSNSDFGSRAVEMPYLTLSRCKRGSLTNDSTRVLKSQRSIVCLRKISINGIPLHYHASGDAFSRSGQLLLFSVQPSEWFTYSWRRVRAVSLLPPLQ